MNDNNAVDTVRDSLTAARDSLIEVHMTAPLDTIVRHGRARVGGTGSPAWPGSWWWRRGWYLP